MNIEIYEKLKDKLCTELEELYRKKDMGVKDMNMQDLDQIQKLTDSIKNIDKIIMLEEGNMDGYSRADGYPMPRDYARGNSYARRGTHYVRAHYSRDGEDMPRDRRYSRDGGGDIIDRMHEMLNDADEHDRKAIERCIKELNG